MKVSYDRKADIATLELSSRPIAYAEEAGPFIIHYDKHHAPTVVEILDASEFLTKTTQATMRASSEKPMALKL